MKKKKIVLYLTDIAHHVKDLRPAKTLEKSLKGPTPEGLPYGRLAATLDKDGELRLKLPDDMQAAINRGELEVVLAFPKKGLPAYAGKDTVEKVRQMEKQATNEIIHREKIAEKKRSIL